MVGHVFKMAALAALVATPALADPVFNAPPPKNGESYPECYCTNRGVRVPIGAMSCLRIGNREFTARCGMSLNNPAWRDMKEGCQTPLSQATPDSDFIQPG